MLVKTITQVPDNIFQPALAEIESIDWQQISDPSRSSSKVFSTSSAIHIRAHKPPQGKPLPRTIEEWSVITECIDHPQWVDQFHAVRLLANWMMESVEGKALGRIMIVNLAAQGNVPPHIDPLDYFAMYSRFHVPFKTNAQVVFSGGAGTAEEHMPYQTLCQLNNRLMHRLDNRSQENRIHVIVDIALENGNQIF
jgi:hypothetical protein